MVEGHLGNLNNARFFTFITFDSIDYSRSGVYLDRQPNDSPLNIVKLSPKFTRFFAELWRERKKLRNEDQVLIVLSPCSVLVPFIKILSTRPIVLDAGWPLTDAELGKIKTLVGNFKYLKAWLIDFLAFHLARITILESNAQKVHVSRTYLIRQSKLKVLFTGVNENKYLLSEKSKDKKTLTKYNNILKSDFVFFRGKNNSESGINNIIKIADESKNNYKFVILTNKTPNNFKIRSNVLLISEHISDFEISLFYQKCFLSLGQLSKSKRLDRTIPHKAFEAGFFGTSYLTLKRDGITEFLNSDAEAIFIEDIDITKIAEIIDKFQRNLKLQRKLKANIKEKYSSQASQAKLKQSFFSILNALN